MTDNELIAAVTNRAGQIYEQATGQRWEESDRCCVALAVAMMHIEWSLDLPELLAESDQRFSTEVGKYLRTFSKSKLAVSRVKPRYLRVETEAKCRSECRQDNRPVL